MPIEPNSALALVKSIADAAKGLSAARTEKELAPIRQTLADAQQLALDLQYELAVARVRIDELEKAAREAEDQRRELEQYELFELYRGVRVLRRDPSMSPNESPVYACTRCYSDKQISILQRRDGGSWDITHNCLRCQASFTEGPNPRARV